ncbi:cobalt-precorrin-7 (C(5))-methyltransferase [Hippea alviniae]|uniref:cobalt-precorrin-7 (C(5))-methyltransferase n=1 Tax=Hippea alviniae TaxID=1279027 RepID=UPI0003B65F39|nr:cobalt-precorrin-7 (C(5))-methyltransferase [Hippea alviniae]
MSEKHKNIWIISAGLGSKDFLTYRAVKTASDMDILAGDRRFESLFEHKNYVVLNRFFEDVDRIAQDTSSKIGFVVSGDASFFSLAKYIYEKYSERIVEVVPGVSSFQMAFSRLFETYEDVKFVSFHKELKENFKLGRKTFILCGKNKPSEILYYLDNKIADYDKFVCYNLGLKDEKIVKVEGDYNVPDSGLAVIVLIKRDG